MKKNTQQKFAKSYKSLWLSLFISLALVFVYLTARTSMRNPNWQDNFRGAFAIYAAYGIYFLSFGFIGHCFLLINSIIIFIDNFDMVIVF